jgi:hypothetical protein
VGGHRGHFFFLATVENPASNNVLCGCVVSVPWSGIAGPKVILYEHFVILFLKVATLFYASSVHRFPFLHIVANVCYRLSFLL